MLARRTYKTQKKEKGLVLLVLVIIIVLAFVTYSFSGISITQVQIDQSKKTMIAMKEAKQALINYAVTYIDRTSGSYYGFLPYPETQLFDDGDPDTPDDGKTSNTPPGTLLKNKNAIGWLPWRALDIANLKDESGTCLFYAVSGTYKFGSSVKADMVNEDSIGMFRIKNSADVVIQGATKDSQVVALVIAPGAALAGQSRNSTEILSSCGQDYDNISAYLEGNGVTDNSVLSTTIDDEDNFIHATATSGTEDPPYNDKFLTITRDEIWPAIVNRSDFKQDMKNLTQGLAMCLAEYANLAENTNRRLPWPVITDMGVTTNYRVNNNYTDDNRVTKSYSGRYPFNIDDTNDALGAPGSVDDDLFNIIVGPIPPSPTPPNTLCDNLDLSGSGAGPFVNLNTGSYRQLWNNWKDHFFYVLSKSYEPGTGVEIECSDPGASCITVNTTKHAGAVIFSGSRLSGVTRNDKWKVEEYLENDKALRFDEETTSPSGDRTYSYTNPEDDPDTVNDIMFCIQDQATGTALDVVECP